MPINVMPYLIVYMPLARREAEQPSMLFFDRESDARTVFTEYTTGYAQWVVLIDPEDKIIEQHGEEKEVQKYVNALKDIMDRRAALPGNTRALPSGS